MNPSSSSSVILMSRPLLPYTTPHDRNVNLSYGLFAFIKLTLQNKTKLIFFLSPFSLLPQGSTLLIFKKKKIIREKGVLLVTSPNFRAVAQGCRPKNSREALRKRSSSIA